MLLVSGGPGSGKTQNVLDQVRAAIRAGRDDFRLLTPTATMAEFLRNRLAREGLVFHPGSVLTLAKFVDDSSPDLRQVSGAQLRLMVDDAIEGGSLAAFQDVCQYAGFREVVAALIQEFAQAGCDSTRVRELIHKHGLDVPYGSALAAIMAETEAALRQRKLVMRAEKLRAAAERVSNEGLHGIECVLMDGFASFSDPELALLEALASRCDLTVTLPSSPGAVATRQRLLGLGACERRCEQRRREPCEVLVAAPAAMQEGDEIARRILEQHAAGRPFREMGVIVRSEQPVVPLLRSAFDRFGIPARFYFSLPLDSHPVVRFLAGCIDALLAGWPHDAMPALLRAGFGYSSGTDRADFAIREALPGQGLQNLPEPGGAWLAEKLEQLETWRTAVATPAQWAEHLASLRALFVPADMPGAIMPEAVEVWRSQSWALRQFEGAIREAADASAVDASVPLAEFWPKAAAALRLSSLRVPDHRRDVVHVMDVYEARQWELPVVFVCGLIEKQFPKYHAQNPLLPDAARRKLNQDGLRLATSAEQQAEECYLFDVATSRATELQVLSYAKCNAKGDENLRSFFLEERACALESARPARPKPRWERPTAVRATLSDAGVRDAVSKRHKRFSATGIETYLHCPYQFFAAKTLALQPAPAAPADRLDPLLLGKIAHEAIRRWQESGGTIAAIVDEVFDRALAESRIPAGYRAELERITMQRVLAQFAAQPPLLPGWEQQAERTFTIELREDVSVAGCVDRYDVSADGRVVVLDYKYSGKRRVETTIQGHKDGKNVQAAVYLLAIAREFGYTPAGMFYWALKAGEPAIGGWYVNLPDWNYGANSTQQELDEQVEGAERAFLRAVDEIRAGRIEATPEEKICGWCDFFDVCRTRVAVDREAVAGGDE